MATEIERKFLVVGDGWRAAGGTPFSQGYLNRDQARTVRVRVACGRAYLTIKGRSRGISRLEFEYEIPVAEGNELLSLCDGPIIQKLRYEIWYQGMKWEVDEFLGDNAGLVVAEIELKSEDQKFEAPRWVGQEISDDPRYFNSRLAIHPYTTW